MRTTGWPSGVRMSSSPSNAGAAMKHQSALWQPLMNVAWPHTRQLPSAWRTARLGLVPGPPPPHITTRGLSTYTSRASSGSMPPAAMALISEPSITFHATDASMAAMASSTSMVSPTLASSPPSAAGSVKRNMPASMSASTQSWGSFRSCWASSPPLAITSCRPGTRSMALPVTVDASVIATWSSPEHLLYEVYGPPPAAASGSFPVRVPSVRFRPAASGTGWNRTIPVVGGPFDDIDELLRRQRTTKAAAEIRRRMWTAPGDPELIARLATVHVMTNDSGRGLALAEQAVALGPACARAWSSLGFALTARQDPAGATAAYERSLVLDPRPGAAHNLALLHLGRRDASTAEAVVRTQLQLTPHDDLLLGLLAHIAGEQGRRRRRIALVWQRFRHHPGARQLEDLIDDLRLVRLAWLLWFLGFVVALVAGRLGHYELLLSGAYTAPFAVLLAVGALALLAGQAHRLFTRRAMNWSRIFWALATLVLFAPWLVNSAFD